MMTAKLLLRLLTRQKGAGDTLRSAARLMAFFLTSSSLINHQSIINPLKHRCKQIYGHPRKRPLLSREIFVHPNKHTQKSTSIKINDLHFFHDVLIPIQRPVFFGSSRTSYLHPRHAHSMPRVRALRREFDLIFPHTEKKETQPSPYRSLPPPPPCAAPSPRPLPPLTSHAAAQPPPDPAPNLDGEDEGVGARARGARTARGLLQRRRRDLPCHSRARRLRGSLAMPCPRTPLGSCLACLPMRNLLHCRLSSLLMSDMPVALPLSDFLKLRS